MDKIPLEIILEIVTHLEVEGDHQCNYVCPYITQLKHLAETSRTLSHIVTPFLYSHDAVHAGRAIVHGALRGSIRTIDHSLSLGSNVNRKILLQLPGYSEAAVGTALHVAACEGQLAVVEYLIENNAYPSLSCLNVCGCQHGDHPYSPSPPWSALHIALCRDHVEVAEYLVSRGANFIISREFPGNEVDEMTFMRDNTLVRRSSRGVHVLELVAKKSNVQMFRFLLVNYREKLVFDEYRVSSITPLHHAARITDNKESLEIMRTLLDLGAKLKPDIGTNRNRKTPGPLPFDKAFISWVARFENAKRGRIGTRVGDPYTQLLSFLRYFAEEDRKYLGPLRERALELWMDRGPGRLDSGWSLLYHAFGVFDVEEPKPAVIRQWVMHSIRDPKLESIGPMTTVDVLRFIPRLGFSDELLQPMDELLLEAACLGMAEECSWFVEHGAKVGASDAEGRTALHLAAKAGSVEAVRVLVGHGASWGATDGGGNTVADIARRFRRWEVLVLYRGEEGGGGNAAGWRHAEES